MKLGRAVHIDAGSISPGVPATDLIWISYSTSAHHSRFNLFSIPEHHIKLPGLGAPGASGLRRPQQEWEKTRIAAESSGTPTHEIDAHNIQNKGASQTQVSVFSRFPRV